MKCALSFTYEVAPVFVLMEAEVLRGLRQLVGWPQGDGLFCPGGSTSNMYAMNLARYQMFPEVKSQGLWKLPRLTVFTSSQVNHISAAHLEDAAPPPRGLPCLFLSVCPPRATTL